MIMVLYIELARYHCLDYRAKHHFTTLILPQQVPLWGGLHIITAAVWGFIDELVARTQGWAVGLDSAHGVKQLGVDLDCAAIPRIGSWDPLELDFGINGPDKIATSTSGGGLNTLGVSLLDSCICILWMVVITS